MHKIQSVQILMSVLMKQMIVLKHVQTLLEASFVDVIVVIYWMMMGLLVMVCRSCIIIAFNNTYKHKYVEEESQFVCQ